MGESLGIIIVFSHVRQAADDLIGETRIVRRVYVGDGRCENRHVALLGKPGGVGVDNPGDTVYDGKE
jgi:hypothetical protein